MLYLSYQWSNLQQGTKFLTQADTFIFAFQEVTKQYLEVAKKHGLTLVELALGFTRDRSFMTSTIIGATSLDQLKEDINAFLSTQRPLPPQVMADVENVFKRYKDPAID